MDARSWNRSSVVVGSMIALGCMSVACAAGDPRFGVESPAGFFAGLWHGIISVISLIVGLFHEGVEVYERSNTGGWYDFGFLLGVTLVWGGGSHTAQRRGRSRREQQQWEELGRTIEAKIQRKIRQWSEAEPDEDWDVVEAKATAKLKRRLRAWAEDADESAGPKRPA